MSAFPLKSEQEVIEMRRIIQKTGVEQPAYASRPSVSAIAVYVKSYNAERWAVLNCGKTRRFQTEDLAGR
jgi:hypothetical protein